jgi:hypothetical protein
MEVPFFCITAVTVPLWGLSFAVSGIIMPQLFFFSRAGLQNFYRQEDNTFLATNCIDFEF